MAEVKYAEEGENGRRVYKDDSNDYTYEILNHTTKEWEEVSYRKVSHLGKEWYVFDKSGKYKGRRTMTDAYTIIFTPVDSEGLTPEQIEEIKQIEEKEAAVRSSGISNESYEEKLFHDEMLADKKKRDRAREQEKIAIVKEELNKKWGEINIGAAPFQRTWKRYYDYFDALNPEYVGSYFEDPYERRQELFFSKKNRGIDYFRNNYIQLSLLYPATFTLPSFQRHSPYFPLNETQKVSQTARLTHAFYVAKKFIENKEKMMELLDKHYPTATPIGEAEDLQGYIKTITGVEGFDFLFLTFVKEIKKTDFIRLIRALCTNKTSFGSILTNIESDPIFKHINDTRLLACSAEGGARRTRRKVRKSRKAKKARKQSRRSK